MLLVIDNFDSFTYNLVHFLGELGAECAVYRNNALTSAEIAAMSPSGIVISPGPATPDKAGVSLEAVAVAAEKEIPLLGVCLGHQTIGQYFGGEIIRGEEIKHGKTDPIHHDGLGLFEGLPSPMIATRYHSLVIDPAKAPNCLTITARTADGVIMGAQHATLPIHGVQFHPESIATENGKGLLKNFLRLSNIPLPLLAAA